jgi:DNA-binding transcriptional ArsR family regulator
VKTIAPKTDKRLTPSIFVVIIKLDTWDIEIRKALSHATKRKIIDLLADENLSFMELLARSEEPDEHGNFGYHLRQLVGFLDFDPATKKYELNYRGKILKEVICEFRRIVQKGKQPFEYVEQLKNREHAFCLYESESFKQGVVLSFFKAGLLKGNALVSVVGEENLDREVLTYKKHGIDFDSLPKGALTVLSSFEWYIQKGKADAKTITKNTQRLVKEKKEAGFLRVQVAGEAETFVDNGKTEELLRYEESLGSQLGLDLSAICLYDKKRFEEIGVSHFFNAHGHIITEEFCGKIHCGKNKEYAVS